MSTNAASYTKLVGRLLSTHIPQLPLSLLHSTINDDDIPDGQDSVAETDSNSSVRKGRSKNRNKNPADRIPRPSSFLFKGTGKKSRGHRRSRRYENAMYLATYVAETEEDFYNFDVTPEHNNAFTRLLQDAKQLQVWQEFLELTGEEQEKILFTEEKDSKVHSENEPKSKIATTKDQETASIRFSQSSGELEVTNGKKSSPKKKSKTTYIPNRDLSYILKRHNPPLDTLDCIEDELRDIFSDDSDTVLIYMETSGYFSLLLSAVTEHLDLTLKRLKAPGGLSLIQLECNHEFSEVEKRFVDAIKTNKRIQH